MAKFMFWGGVLFFFVFFFAGNPFGFGQDLKTDRIFPLPLSVYQNKPGQDLQSLLLSRIEQEPFNLVASLIFMLALIHTFASGLILRLAKRLQTKEFQQNAENPAEQQGEAVKKSSQKLSVKVATLHLFGEIEIVFALWAAILGAFFVYFINWASFLSYLENQVSFTEPVFVVVIMAVCSTRPIQNFSERLLKKVSGVFARLFKTKMGAFWFVTLFFGSFLGSLITEPAAVTIVALMLGQYFFPYTQNQKLKYFTLAVFLLNISLGGTLTHFSAPPIFIVAETWGITTPYIFEQIGLRSLGVVFFVTLLGLGIFYKEFKKIDQQSDWQKKKSKPVPLWLILVHLLFIAWIVFNAHHPVVFVATFLFFLGFLEATQTYQNRLDLKGPLLIGLFLAGLVVHGGLQSWWLEPLLGDVGKTQTFFTAIFLTSFNDNAAVTYLASLLPDFSVNLRLAVLSGAMVGGGLTVMANAPNPTAFNLLARYFPGQRIGHFRFFLYAVPLMLVAVCFFLISF